MSPTYSPSQALKIEQLESMFPSTRFDVVDCDPYSRALVVEAEDMEGFSSFVLTATGRAVDLAARGAEREEGAGTHCQHGVPYSDRAHRCL